MAFPQEAVESKNLWIGNLLKKRRFKGTAPDSFNAAHSRYDFILIDEKIGEDNILTLAGLAKNPTKNSVPFIILMASELVNNSKLANAVDALLKKPLTITDIDQSKC